MGVMAVVAFGKGGRESSRRGTRLLAHREAQRGALQGMCELAAAASMPPPTTAPAAARLKKGRLDLYCSLPTATNRIPASSDPDHLPLVVLVRNTCQGRAEEASGLVCRKGLVSCGARVRGRWPQRAYAWGRRSREKQQVTGDPGKISRW
jgi:hypothetical protein